MKLTLKKEQAKNQKDQEEDYTQMKTHQIQLKLNFLQDKI